MRQLLALIAAAVFALGPATPVLAQAVVTTPMAVSPEFWGINASHELPSVNDASHMMVHHRRLWGWADGGVAHSTFWNITNTGPGVYDWTHDDNMKAAYAGRGYLLEWTFGQVPSWINSKNQLDNDTELGYFLAYVAAFVDRMGPGFFKYWSTWNEADLVAAGQGWTGTPAMLAKMSRGVYAIIKARDPNAVILAPSFIQGGPVADAYFADCQANLATLGPCFDWVNYHGYLGIYATSQPSAIAYAPELILSLGAADLAAAAAHGFATKPFAFDEYWTGPTAVGFSDNSDTAAYGHVIEALLMQSRGVRFMNVHDWGGGDNVTVPNLQGTWGYGNMSNTAVALRVAAGITAGGFWSKPPVRSAGTNQIPAIYGAGAATGKLSGSVSCAGGASGTGSMGSGVAVFNAHPSTTAMYLQDFGAAEPSTGLPYVKIMVCSPSGDMTAGSGNIADALSYGAISMTTASFVHSSANIGLDSGSVTSASVGAYPQLNMYQSNGTTFTEYCGFISTWPVLTSALPLSQQHYEFLCQPQNALTALGKLSLTFSHTWSAASPQPYSATFTISAPAQDLAAGVWEGELRGADGVTRCVAWDDTGGPTTYTPSGSCAGYGFYRDIYGQEHTVSGSVNLTRSPIWLEPAAHQVRF